LDESSWRFDPETKELKTRVEAEAEKNTKLYESVKDLRNKCVDFATRCADFCALVASRGPAAAFMKAGCTHAKTVNKTTSNLSTSDIVDIPAEA
jgi:phage FluMu protein Com